MEVIEHLPYHARKRSRCWFSEPEEIGAKMTGPGRAHGLLVGQGKKGMQGKETVGVLPLRCGQFNSA